MSLITIFKEQVQKFPARIALATDGVQLSYQELDYYSDVLASLMHQRGENPLVESNQYAVLIKMKSSIEFVISVLASLKLGMYYIPSDSEEIHIRTQEKLHGHRLFLALVLDHGQIEQKKELVVSLASLRLLAQIDFRPVERYIHDIAYVVYTSGSTGKPKGVVIEDASLIALMHDNSYLEHFDNDIIGAISNVSFDAKSFEIWQALLNGLTCHVIPDLYLFDAKLMSDYFEKHQITTLFLTTALFNTYAEDRFNPLLKLKQVLFGGEKANSTLVRKVLATGDLKVIHVYGPTETTTFSTYCQLDISMIDEDVPIGEAIPGYTHYILSDGQLASDGEIGELYIGGCGVTQGYFQDNALTTDKFQILNISGVPDRVYKTGDLVKKHHGRIIFCGRADNQIKLRGFRIELEEIEKKISANFKVQNIVVFTKGVICCFYQSHPTEFRTELTHLLPDYMIPGYFFPVEEFKLNQNRKIDRKHYKQEAEVLLQPKEGSSSTNYDYSNTTKTTKTTLRKIWNKLLQTEDFSDFENFFDLGGKSLHLIKMKSELTYAFPSANHISIVDLLTYPTIDGLTKRIMQTPNDLALTEVNMVSDEQIAIISVSGLFPKALDEEQFFQNIEQGVDCVSYDKYIDNYIAAFGKVDDIYTFDPGFFNIVEGDAKGYDPQIRKFIEHSYRVLEKAGYAYARQNLNIALYAGTGESEYLERYSERAKGNWAIETANGYKFLATRTSYILNLKGNSLNVNTGCSTSLVAIIQACEALAAMRCDLAIAGGVHFSDESKSGHFYQDGSAYSKSGICSPFDTNADGMVEGNALGVVLLKRAKEALRDGDTILGIISGYALNNDGREKIGYTAPSVIGQATCIAQAQQMAGVTFHDISYIECHGTGTQLGDPVEYQALKSLLDGTYAPQRCALGSVKANIGHTIYASGVSSVIKICKMLEHDVLPPQINFTVLNNEINFDDTPFFINQTQQKWSDMDHNKRIAAVSSFGIGGTNAHIIIEEGHKPLENADEAFYLFPISAKSATALDKNIRELKTYLAAKPALSSVAYTLQERREHFKFRSFLLNNSNGTEFLTAAPVTAISEPPTLVMLFPGQGSQFKEMGKQLYKKNVEFKKHIDHAQTILMPFGINLLNILWDDSVDIDNTQNAQLAIFTVSYAVGKTLASYQITPDCYVGHSIGELVAATLAEVMNIETALELVYHRGRLMNSMPKSGMLSIVAKRNEIEKSLFGTLTIAVSNGSENYVVSGSLDEIEILHEQLKLKNIKSTKLRVSHGFHSSYMARAADEFEQICKRHQFNQATRPFVSNISGDWITAQEYLSPTYWADHIRKEVKFYDSIEKIIHSYKQVVLYEIGANNVLASLVRKIDSSTVGAIISSMSSHRNRDLEAEQLFKSIGQLWQHGVSIDWGAIYPQRTLNVDINLPTYVFEQQRLKVEQQSYETSQIAANSLYRCQYEEIHTAFQTTNILYLYFVESLTEVELIRAAWGSKNIIFVLYDAMSSGKFIRSTLYSCNGDETGFNALIAKLTHNTLQISILYQWCQITDYHLIELARTWKQFLGQIKVPYTLTVVSEYLDVFEALDTKYIEQCEAVAFFKTLSHEIIIPFRHISNNSQLDYVMLFALCGEEAPLGEYVLKSKRIYHKRYRPIQAINDNQLGGLKDDDVVLITGGSGGVGLALAKRLAEKHRLTFILISRSGKFAAPDTSYGKKQIELLNTIEVGGSCLALIACDVSNREDFQQVIRNCYRKYGTIDMIVHAAGIPPLVGEKNYDKMQEVIRVKKDGALVLLQEIQTPVKYFLMTSSLASIFHDPQRLEYDIANTYLDKLAYFDHHQIKRILTLNLPNVVGLGAEVRYNYQYSKNKNILENAVYEQELIDTVEKTLFNTYYPHVIYSKVEPELQLRKMSELIHHVDLTLQDTNESIEQQVIKLIENILQTSNVSAKNSLIELGLDSLNGVQLIYMIDKLWGLSLSIREILELNKLQDLIRMLENSHHAKPSDGAAPTQLTAERLPLSNLQKSLYYTQQLEASSAHYNIIFAMRHIAEIDPTRFEMALRKTLRTHRELTAQVNENEQGELFSQSVELTDAHHIVQVVQANEVQSFIEYEKDYEFDLTKEFPVRVTMVKQLESTEIIFSIHHLFFDGWSVNLFLEDLQNYYQYPERTVKTESGYAEYLAFEDTFLAKKAQVLDFWQNILLDAEINPQKRLSYTGENCAAFEKLRLSRKLSTQLKAAMVKHKTTDFNFFMGNFFYALNQLEPKSIICTPFANRLIPQFYSTVGYFANVLPIYLPATDSPLAAILSLKNIIDELSPYQTTPLTLLIELLNLRFKCDSSKQLLKNSFGYFDMSGFKRFALTESFDTIYMIDPNKARFPLSLFVEKYEFEYLIKVEYNRYLTAQKDVLQILKYYTASLAQILECNVENLLEEIEYVI